MVLSLKAWKSRSLPGLPRTEKSYGKLLDTMISTQKPAGNGGLLHFKRAFSVSRRNGPLCATALNLNADSDEVALGASKAVRDAIKVPLNVDVVINADTA